MSKDVTIIDDNIKYISLGSGTYKIDDEIGVVDANYSYKNIPVENENDVRLVTISKFINYYQDENENKLSVKDYESQKHDLLQPVVYCDEYGTPHWGDNIDEEYTYKKFIHTWNSIYKQVQIISEPIEVSIVNIKDSSKNNPYIVNMFLAGISERNYSNKDKKTFYQYNQELARKFILSEYMKKIGFTFNSLDRYDIKKEWSNSTHSGIRYAKAFGKYLFGKRWEKNYTPRGSLEKLEEMYISDKEGIENIIKTAYVEKFGNINELSYDFGNLLHSLKNIRQIIKFLDYKVKEKDKKWLMLNGMNELIEDIECKLEGSVSIGEKQ